MALDIEKIKSDLEANIHGVTLKKVRESLLIENPEDLPKVALYLKESDDYKMDYLSSVTGSDFVDFLESVYHLYSMEKKEDALTLRVRVKKENPQVPSLVSIYRGAEFQERDSYDLYGIEYTNHPDLRRIMMWEGFEGYPMRKDYEQEDSETLDDTDIQWLEKNGVSVPESLIKKPEVKEEANEETPNE